MDAYFSALSTKDIFLHNVSSKMDTLLSSPEEYLIKIDQKANEFYLMIQGDCLIQLRDRNRNEYWGKHLLVEGEHFGEIALLYKCKRTASVISRNYITTARLDKAKFNMLIIEHPELKKALMKHIYTYSYDRKKYIQ